MHVRVLSTFALRICQRLPLATSRMEAHGASMLRVDAPQFAVDGFDTIARVKICPLVGRIGPTCSFFCLLDARVHVFPRWRTEMQFVAARSSPSAQEQRSNAIRCGRIWHS